MPREEKERRREKKVLVVQYLKSEGEEGAGLYVCLLLSTYVGGYGIMKRKPFDHFSVLQVSCNRRGYLLFFVCELLLL